MTQWISYVGKRIIFAIIVLFILITIIYFLMNLLPYLPIQQGDKQTAEDFHKQLEGLGLTQNVWVRYFKYIGGIFVGDFGLYYKQPSITVTALFFQSVPSTIFIAGMAFIISIILGFLFGIIAAVYRGKFLDTLVNVLSVIFISVPSFIFAIILLKIGGIIGIPLTFVAPDNYDYTFGKMLLSSILPIIALVFGLASTLTYYVRNELVDVLNQEYIKIARSKGLSEVQVLWRHALRNIMIPVLSVIGPSFLYVISGSVVIESFFGVSGVATLLVTGITTRETNLIEFQALFFSGLYFIIQIILDIVYTFIDPRIQLIDAKNNIYFTTFMSNKIKRLIWRRRWEASSSPEYLWLEKNSELYQFLNKNNCFITRNNNKYVSLKIADRDAYQQLVAKKFLIVDQDIFRIQYKKGE